MNSLKNKSDLLTKQVSIVIHERGDAADKFKTVDLKNLRIKLRPKMLHLFL